jgi:hypothetical protein
MNRGHVNQETARQGNVAGNARALFAERLLAIWMTTSWPALSISEMSCGRRGGPERPPW